MAASSLPSASPPVLTTAASSAGNSISIPRLSVLDVAAVGPAVAAEQALRWTTEIAQAAEQLGYHRIWIAEHHAVPDIGASAPAVLIAHLAANTSTLRIGSGGVMLPNHAPLAIAEQFKTLNALHPGRIDLGVGRGKGGSPTATQALRRRDDSLTAADGFSDQLDELRWFLSGDFPVNHPFELLAVSPQSAPPPVYVLGAGVASSQIAAARGLPFVCAHHLAPHETSAALRAYRSSFRPQLPHQEPYAVVTALVVCAARREDAERAAVGATAVRVRQRLADSTGHPADPRALNRPTISADEAVAIGETLSSDGVFVGDPDVLHDDLTALGTRTRADEVMIAFLEYDGPARIRTMTELAGC